MTEKMEPTNIKVLRQFFVRILVGYIIMDICVILQIPPFFTGYLLVSAAPLMSHQALYRDKRYTPENQQERTEEWGKCPDAMTKCGFKCCKSVVEYCEEAMEDCESCVWPCSSYQGGYYDEFCRKMCAKFYNETLEAMRTTTMTTDTTVPATTYFEMITELADVATEADNDVDWLSLIITVVIIVTVILGMFMCAINASRNRSSAKPTDPHTVGTRQLLY